MKGLITIIILYVLWRAGASPHMLMPAQPFGVAS